MAEGNRIGRAGTVGAKPWRGHDAPASSEPSSQPAARGEAGSTFEPSQVPGNQPSARFKGHLPARRRAPGPLPEWLRGAPKKVGIVLRPDPERAWMSRSVFNPSAVVKDGKVHLVIRAEDSTGLGEWHGTSRLGLATSEDGIHFEVRPEPILEPTEWFEEKGGCEDPRVVEIEQHLPGAPNKRYALTYTAFCWPDRTARLALAFSDGLVHWEKAGLMFPDQGFSAGNDRWSKSGAIVPRPVNGEYLMYFGDEQMHLARSKDLVHWEADPEPVLRPRPGEWDGIMVEPGPTPWIDGDGNIHLLYNADAPPDGYAAGEVVFSGKDPRQVLRRSVTPLIGVTEPWEKEGQVGNVLFLEGLAKKDGQAFFYYGAADDKIAVAVADARADGAAD